MCDKGPHYVARFAFGWVLRSACMAGSQTLTQRRKSFKSIVKVDHPLFTKIEWHEKRSAWRRRSAGQLASDRNCKTIEKLYHVIDTIKGALVRLMGNYSEKHRGKGARLAAWTSHLRLTHHMPFVRLHQRTASSHEQPILHAYSPGALCPTSPFRQHREPGIWRFF